jgi:hypothetical protein
MKLFKLTLAIALGAFSIAAPTSEATTFYSRARGNWNNPSTWSSSCNGLPGFTYPQAGDTAYICGHTVTVIGRDGTAEAAIVVVLDANGAVLRMDDDGRLEVSGSVTVNGTGVFEFYADDEETRPDLRATGEGVDLAGTISFPGEAGGRLSPNSNIDYFEVPSSSVTFSGGGSLELDAPLKATGGDVTFTMAFDDTSTGPFKIHDSDSTMTFDQTDEVCFDPGADFFVESDSLLHIMQSVRTLGSFTGSLHDVEIDLGEVFEYDLDRCPP